MGVMLKSTPSKNSDKPIIISTEPIKNLSIKSKLKGVNVKLRIKTRMVIGKTAVITSLNFSLITYNMFTSFVVILILIIS